MRHRREVIAGLGAVVVSHPFAVRAQQQLSGRPRLGILLYTSVKADRNLGAFLRALAERGYSEGRNIAVEYRSAEGQPERLPELAAELVGGTPHVVFALGGDVSPAAAKATQSHTRADRPLSPMPPSPQQAELLSGRRRPQARPGCSRSDGTTQHKARRFRNGLR